MTSYSSPSNSARTGSTAAALPSGGVYAEKGAVRLDLSERADRLRRAFAKTLSLVGAAFRVALERESGNVWHRTSMYVPTQGVQARIIVRTGIANSRKRAAARAKLLFYAAAV
jgi:hypothetical protein